MNRQRTNILDLIDEGVDELTWQKYDADDPCSIDVCFDVEGELEGVGYVVGTFEGTSKVTYFAYDAGDYWTPPYCEGEAEYSGVLTYTTFDDETEKTYKIDKRQI